MENSLFDDCFSIKALELAWERVKASVGSDAKDYFGINIFSENIESCLGELSSELLARQFKPKRPFKYFEPKKTGTQRTKTVLDIEDALVFQAIGNHIGENVYSDLKVTEKFVFGSSLNPDVAKGVKLLDEFPDDFYFFEYYVSLYNRFLEGINETLESDEITYLLETDITGFFDSIPHSTVILELRRRKIDNEILELLSLCLNVWSGTRDSITIGVGIPQGPATSFLLANLILDDLDRIAVRTGIRYYRFMDDIRIYGSSSKILNSNLVLIDRTLKSKSLNLNAQKTSIQKIKEKEDEKEKLLDSSGLDVEEIRQSDFDHKIEIDLDILEQDSTQLKQEIPHYLKRKSLIPIYKALNSSIQLRLKTFIDNNQKKKSSDFSSKESREFFNLSQKWRMTVKVLSESENWTPDKTMIPVWLFGVRKFFWKANIIVWNLHYYDDLTESYEKIMKVFSEFEDYEWVQYQILSAIGSSVKFGDNTRNQFLNNISKTSSPLVRLGSFLVLLDTIKNDSKFFESLAQLIKSEEDDYVKKAILNTIRYKHLNIPIDTLKTWFL